MLHIQHHHKGQFQGGFEEVIDEIFFDIWTCFSPFIDRMSSFPWRREIRSSDFKVYDGADNIGRERRKKRRIFVEHKRRDKKTTFMTSEENFSVF